MRPESDPVPAQASTVEAVRTLCLDAAISAYEDGGLRGLCPEGRWEAAIGAIRQLDLSHALQKADASPSGASH